MDRQTNRSADKETDGVAKLTSSVYDHVVLMVLKPVSFYLQISRLLIKNSKRVSLCNDPHSSRWDFTLKRRLRL